MLNFAPALLAYIGPETIVPLTSALAAIAGAVMMCWSSVRRAMQWCFEKLKGEKSS